VEIEKNRPRQLSLSLNKISCVRFSRQIFFFLHYGDCFLIVFFIGRTTYPIVSPFTLLSISALVPLADVVMFSKSFAQAHGPSRAFV
jgi:hypothetical protein